MIRTAPDSTRLPRGFTMIELLVVITIISIILVMTLGAFRFARESDRVSGAAAQFQSFLAGARDRAIYSREPRGVRLFVEPPPPGSSIGAESRIVTSAAYIAPGGTWGAPKDSGGIDLMRIDRGNGAGGAPDGDFDAPEDYVMKLRGSNNPGWWNLKRRGWLVDGLRIRIPAGPTGTWYTIDTSLININVAPTDNQFLLLEVPYADGGDAGEEIAHTDLTYEIELPSRVLPEEPLLLPETVVIDLDASDVPDVWRPTSNRTAKDQYSGFMDIVFAPRGNVIGDAASKGVIHFYFCDAEDSKFLKEIFIEALADTGGASGSLDEFDAGDTSGHIPFVPMDEIHADVDADSNLTNDWYDGTQSYKVKDRRIVSVFTQTGAVSVHQVNTYVSVTGGLDADPPVVAPPYSVADIFDRYDIDQDGNRNEPDGLADDPYRFAETGEVSK